MKLKLLFKRYGVVNRLKKYNFVKKIYFNSQFYTGPNRLIAQLSEFLPYSGGYYVEIGANDGISQSNTNFLERRFNWIGILIEPVPSVFRKLVKNRSQDNVFWNVACCSFQHNSDEIQMTYGDLMSVSHFESIDLEVKEHILEATNYLASDEQTFTFSAKVKDLQSILKESNAPKLIDFFSLDVEGAEFEILNGIDFDEFNFKYILVESRSLQRILSFLESKSYKFVKNLSNHDYLFRFVGEN